MLKRGRRKKDAATPMSAASGNQGTADAPVQKIEVTEWIKKAKYNPELNLDLAYRHRVISHCDKIIMKICKLQSINQESVRDVKASMKTGVNASMLTYQPPFCHQSPISKLNPRADNSLNIATYKNEYERYPPDISISQRSKRRSSLPPPAHQNTTASSLKRLTQTQNEAYSLEKKLMEAAQAQSKPQAQDKAAALGLPPSISVFLVKKSENSLSNPIDLSCSPAKDRSSLDLKRKLSNGSMQTPPPNLEKKRPKLDHSFKASKEQQSRVSGQFGGNSLSGGPKKQNLSNTGHVQQLISSSTSLTVNCTRGGLTGSTGRGRRGRRGGVSASAAAAAAESL